MLNFIYELATDKRKGMLVSFFKFILYLLSLFYTALVKLLIFSQGILRRKINCQIISVGNITLGGTGKTSLVEYIARYLRKEQKRIAIVSRGYKRISKIKTPGCPAGRQDSKLSYQTMGDEPYMLSKNLKDVPVLVNSQRIEAIDLAIDKYAADTVILDDGFQQWKIKKDLEIVTIDATDPFGNQYLLPRGILRQPLSTLKKADILVITKTNLNPDIQDIKDYLRQINPLALIVEAVHKPVGFYRLGDDRESLLGFETLKGKPVSLFCGIADPDSFENLILSLGINFELMFRFPDHHRYTEEELKDIIEQSKLKNIKTIITTEKDAVRIIDVLGSIDYCLSLYVLRINLEIIQNEIFLKRILSIY